MARNPLIWLIAMVVALFLAAHGAGCSKPSTIERLAPLMGKTGHVLVIADVDASSSQAQWMRDVELKELVTVNGKRFVVVRFVGLEASPANDGKPMEVSLLASHIVEVEIDGKRVFARDER